MKTSKDATITIPANLQFKGISSWSWSPEFLRLKAEKLREREEGGILPELLKGLANAIEEQVKGPEKKELTFTVPVGLWDNWSPDDLRTHPDYLNKNKLMALLRTLADVSEVVCSKPRMEEPEWGEKVSVSIFATTNRADRAVLIHSLKDGVCQWTDGYGTYYCWDNIVDPQPVKS